MYSDGFRFIHHPAVIKRLLAPARIALASFNGKCQNKHTVDQSAASVSSSLDLEILKRPVFVPSFRADYDLLPRQSTWI